MSQAFDQLLSDEFEQGRGRVITESLRWIRTPYQHLGDVFGEGVDCAMLLVRTFVDTGTVAAIDPRPYSPQWHLNRNAERYLEWLTNVADETDAPRPGDVGIWRFGRTFSHGAVLVSGDRRTGNVVHALAAAREVTIQSVTEQPLAGRPVKWYSVFDRMAREAAAIGGI